MDDVKKLEIFLQTLGVTNRLRIIATIGETQKSVGEIVSAVELSQPHVSHHLKALRENGVLETERKGPFIYYRLKDHKLLEILGALSEMAGEVSADASDVRMFCRPPWWGRR